MKKWIISASWMVCSNIEIEASALDKAIKIIRDEDTEILISNIREYIDDN